MSMWTVWVGGGEINLKSLTYEQANYLAMHWADQGYDDVFIEEMRV